MEVKNPTEKVIAPTSDNGSKLDENNMHDGQQFYPEDTQNVFKGKDTVKECAILNNDTTSFVVYNLEDPS